MKNSRFHYEIGCFINFCVQNEKGLKLILEQFWNSCPQNRFLGTPSGFGWADFLCLFADQRVGDTLGGFSFVFLNDVAVKALRGGNAGVAQLL